MPTSMKLLPLDYDVDFNEMAAACWEAFSNPYNSYLRIVFYQKGPASQDIIESIQAAAAGLKAVHQVNPNSHWIKVVDTDTGKLVGAANWMLFEESPYTIPRETPVAVWWPEGDGRNYASHYLKQAVAHKNRLFDRPHVYLNISFTIQEWRRRGVGALLMEWGVQKADEMNVDTFVEASQLGIYLYEKFGFMTVDIILIDTKVEDPSTEWKKLEKEIPPDPQYLMWRPIRGIFEHGKTCLPWSSEPFVPKSIYGR